MLGIGSAFASVVSAVVNTMKSRFRARDLFLICFMVSLFLFTACSSITNFVVINASNHAIEVRYKIKKPTDPREPSGVPVVPPSTKAVSQLQQEIPWSQLSASQYSLDRENREVVLSLLPGQALLIEQRNLLDGPVDDAHQAANFSIEEIHLSGPNGEVHLQGEQARKSFVAESKKLYVITYR